jgi:hypothetical protein
MRRSKWHPPPGKKIKTLITAPIERVNAGSRLVDEAGQTNDASAMKEKKHDRSFSDL